ncbi:hypothetical protein BS78_02G259200 [Paspalum vaginatum]|nr:hypothetical protein BS78_02G259200 [Paspalum vaginatum]
MEINREVRAEERRQEQARPGRQQAKLANARPRHPSLHPDQSSMKTLQQQEQQAHAAAMSRPSEGGAAASPKPPAPEDFTPPELDVAEALTCLSAGSTSSVGGGGASAASGSSSPHSVSVNAPAPAPARELALPRGPGAGGDGDEEEDEQEVPGSQRRTKRYRPIAEIYRATDRFARSSIRGKKE